MALIEQIPLDSLDGLDLLPLASLRHPVSYFEKTLGFRFALEHDDLDEYAIAALLFPGDGVQGSTVFALKAYRGGPPGAVDVMLPSVLLKSPHSTRLIMARISRELHVDAERIGWSDEAAAMPRRVA